VDNPLILFFFLYVVGSFAIMTVIDDIKFRIFLFALILLASVIFLNVQSYNLMNKLDRIEENILYLKKASEKRAAE